MSERYPEIKGHPCPACGGMLFVGEGGYITCSWHQCPSPDYAIILASELQRVTPSLPQTEDEWKQCTKEGRRVVLDSPNEWWALLGANGGELWIAEDPENTDRSTDIIECSMVTALDPPWVPEDPPEEDIVGWVNVYDDGTFGGVYDTRQEPAGASTSKSAPCKVVRVVAVGDGDTP